MPWECCGTTLLDSKIHCPACGITKKKWTIKFQATRVIRIGGQKKLKGEVDEPLAYELESEVAGTIRKLFRLPSKPENQEAVEEGP